jgi:AAA family ATP:ADP antiporter
MAALRTWARSSFAELVASAINLFITPLVHRWLGAKGLFAQPLAVMAGSLWHRSGHLQAGAFSRSPTAGCRIPPTGVSKELLYVPIDPLLIFQAKA